MRHRWWIGLFLIACDDGAAPTGVPDAAVEPVMDRGITDANPMDATVNDAMDAATDAAGPPDVGPDAYDVPDMSPDGCAPRAEQCDGVDDDCDGRADEDFDLETPCGAGPGDACQRIGAPLCDGPGEVGCDAAPATVAECTAAFPAALAAGARHTCVVGEDQRVRCVGANDHGQLGIGTDRYPTPADGLVPLPAPVVQIAAGGDTTCVVDDERAVRCWGRDDRGQLGLGAWWQREAPFPTATLPIAVDSVAARAGRTCVAGGGQLVCWGDNAAQLLGVDDTRPRGLDPRSMRELAAVDLDLDVARVVVGRVHTCALSDQGQVKCWGRDPRGQLGRRRPGPVVVAPADLGAALPLVELPGPVEALVSGADHVCALMQDAAVICWGDNADGQLGRPGPGFVDDERVPADLALAPVALAAGAHHTCALDAAGRVKCWGANTEGQLGQGDRADRGLDVETLGEALAPVDLDMQVRAVTAGAAHTCALGVDGQVKCWGANDHGQLGLGDTARRGRAPNEMGAALPVVALGVPVVEIAAGEAHTCARDADGGVYCWGANADGQLGLAGRDARGDAPGELDALRVDLPEPALGLIAGDHHTCVRTEGGLRCFGRNVNGQLGLGTEWHLADPFPALDLGFDAARVSVGAAHACALGVDGEVKCWGSAEFGQVQSVFDAVGTGPDQMGVALTPVRLGLPAVDVQAGDAVTCALRRDGQLLCWGRPEQSGAVEGVSAVNLGLPLSALTLGGSVACALADDGRVKCWGDNRLGNLGLGDAERRRPDRLQAPDGFAPLAVPPMTRLAAGADHACGLTGDGQVYCWGLADVGQLGAGDTETLGDAPGELATPVELDLVAMHLVAGAHHTCAIGVDGRVKCWGENADGQLGLDPSPPLGDGPDEMGGALPANDLQPPPVRLD